MPDSEKLRPSAAQSLTPGDPVPAEQPFTAPPLAPRVRWGRAAVLQLVAGGIAGFAVPIVSSVYTVSTLSGTSNSSSGGFGGTQYASDTETYSELALIIIALISAVLVGLFGGGIPLLSAWGAWRIVSRRRRALRREVLAVVFGAIGGSLVASAPAFMVIAGWPGPWPWHWAQYVVQVLLLGGIPALAFALWVTAAWRRARKATAASFN